MEQENGRITVSTSIGEITGTETERCYRFFGIPFARAERFRYAEPTGNLGAFDAVRPGPSCPQNRAWHEHLEHPTRRFYKREFRENIPFTYGEDCLNLNIYAPKKAEKCPVIVYFYGGGFDSGMNCEGPFDGSALAQQGIVTVFPNYRVGPLGYLTHEKIRKEFGRDGNFGLDDMVVALRWVKAHILAFGGDPDNVTVMGQSAGAMSIQYLCLNPMNRELFRRAVMMSGAGLFPDFSLPKEAEKTRAYWQQFIETSGCSSFEEFKQLDLDSLFDTVEKMKEIRKDSVYNTMPVIDGYLIPAPIQQLIKNPLPLDYMIGYTNADLFAPLMARIGNAFGSRAGAYIYFFDIDAPGDANGAFHSSDLRYMFGTLEGSWRPYRECDYAASDLMIRYLAAFARTGDPNGDGRPYWKKAEKGLRTPVLRITENGAETGRADYGKLIRNLSKGEPKA